MSAARRLGLAAFLAVVALSARPTDAAAQWGFVLAWANPTSITFPTPTVADFDAGYIDRDPVAITILSFPRNRDWELHIQATDPDLGVYGKPLSDLLWREEGSSSWTPLSLGDELVLSGRGSSTVRVYFRMRLDWAYDVPGTYEAALTFTALQP